MNVHDDPRFQECIWQPAMLEDACMARKPHVNILKLPSLERDVTNRNVVGGSIDAGGATCRQRQRFTFTLPRQLVRGP